VQYVVIHRFLSFTGEPGFWFYNFIHRRGTRPCSCTRHVKL